MQFDEMGNKSGKTLMLLPGTACDYQTNFGTVLERLGEKYHLICVNYDGFDGSDRIFPDMVTVTEKIEKYIRDNYNGKIDGAIGSSLGSSFVGQLVQRENIHIDHAIFGSPDLDQSGKFSAWLQSKLVVPLLTGFTKNEKRKKKKNTKAHFIYANKMGEKYLKRYKKYFRDPDIREFDMQHEQWLFGGQQYTAPVLTAIDEFMEACKKKGEKQ